MLIVFDVDGTLVDSREIILAAQRETFRAHGIEPPEPRRALSIVGLSLPIAIETLVGPDAPIEALCETYKSVFNRLRADAELDEPLFPGVADLLDDLGRRGDVTLGIATGKTRRGADYIIERHRWQRLFATIQTADSAPSKPDPGMLVNAMAETGIGAERTVMVGDTTFDLAMAVAAGCRAIGVDWGHHEVADLTRAGAEQILTGIDGLMPYLAAGTLARPAVA